jgi:DNA-directed RNA polymerase specialized sigma24 family protein
MAKSDPKRRWEPGEGAFHRFLAWLDEGVDSQGERYLDMRDRLVHYFARRSCPGPDDLADETLNRVARRLDENGWIDIGAPARYCYIVAKFVLLESLRERARQPGMALSQGADPETVQGTPMDDTAEEREPTFACLERCLDACTPAERELILDYYKTTSGRASTERKQLAERLGLTANSLAIRACRIRSRLETCVRACRGR